MTEPERTQARLFDDADPEAELHLQRVLASRRRANASGQCAEDAANIRAALVARRLERGIKSRFE